MPLEKLTGNSQHQSGILSCNFVVSY
jgi:hypothetical protein